MFPVFTDIELFNPLNAELNPIRHLLALVGARHTVHVSRIMVKIPQNMSYNNAEEVALDVDSR